MTAHRPRPVVELYERIVDNIRSGIHPPGSTLPSEPRLAADLGVSRPALREALILLQEDGVITVRRGVGRTVSKEPLRRGFERLQPFEQLLGGHATKVRPLQRGVEEPTDFVLRHLPVPASREIRFWESVIVVDGVPACLTEEWSLHDEALDEVATGLSQALDDAQTLPHTMVHALTTGFPSLPLRGTSSVSATILGQRRGVTFGRPSDTPAVLITQVVSVENAPLITAKYLLPSGAPTIVIRQAW
ncbi:GntR family transcriptional regulator [Actinokineospora enzanensis]|uniref:GntR family transcriptional regulator n=1 Tax=Actinokineospora enzanensis TaxID=155975 RepID=UPI00037E2B70|nr:GntR family transcriptional regulator [Actinokineospora enzanensis]